ncbi:MAG: universal stress protein [Cellulomonas sp.]|uniref:universal stress protein n=1 Tax=Cellulomonas sp. TaxID=40001 RepID=UPI00179C8732|nr:universal stress protein [Cellulomonas sp.]NMM31016.1 universal stress protein [Cellulomonas sp.]
MRADGPVVIALDGSPHSAHTLEWGLHEASLRGADVLLARAWTDPRDLVEWSWYPLVDAELAAEATSYLSDMQAVAADHYPDLTVTTTSIRGGEVSALRGLSESAQLLVVGARGRAGRLRVGPIAAHLAAHSRSDVAVVRGDETAAPAAGSPIVVGVDGSRASLAAAEAAARASSMRSAPLLVVHARPTAADLYGRGMPALSPQAATEVDEHDPTHRAAQAVAARLRAEHPGLEVRTALLDDDPAHALVAASQHAVLVVVGSRGLGAFRGMLLGSVSADVVRNAASTVLVLHDGLHAGQPI